MSTPEFIEFPKIARLSRECIITEKIDGTNGCILINEAGQMFAGSRSRWITPEQDNYGFARWARANESELLKLGPGRHFGEWWGSGIQRGYGLPERRFSLFNVTRWAAPGAELLRILSADPRIERWQEHAPACCHVVPVIARGVFDTRTADLALAVLNQGGSIAAPGFMRPEGIVVFHVAGNVGFKKTIEKDEAPKGAARTGGQP